MSHSIKIAAAAFAMAALAMAVFAKGAWAEPNSGALVVTAVAPSSNSYVVKQTVVRYGDLDVSNQQGAVALYGRINDVALRLCGAGRDLAVPLRLAGKIENCRASAVADAVAHAASPLLTQAAAAGK